MLSSWGVCCGRVQQRWIFAVMGCWALANSYMMRICLSLAITEMVVTTTDSSSNDTSLDDTCPTSNDETSSSLSGGGTYEWDEYTQGVILSSFYWGNILTQLPGGLLADKFGGKYTLGLGILLPAIFTTLTPTVVQSFDSTGLIVLRIVMGFTEGPVFPAISVMIAQWAPPLERSKVTAVVMSGMAIGTIVGNALTGVLLQNSSMGWPMVFYVYGPLGMLWFCVWLILGHNSPDTHPFITEEERTYLSETVNRHTREKAQPTPWRHIMTSRPFLALIVAKVGFCWCYFVMFTDLPLYMSKVLHYSIQTNGFLTALPHVILWIIANVSAWLADWLIETEKLSRTNVRKILHTVASVFPAIFIITASYAGCDRTLVVILFTIGVDMMGPYYITTMVNPNDLSPNHSGILMGIVSVAVILAAVLAPYLVGVLTPSQTLSEWRLVFWITFVLFIGTSVIFNVWGSGDVQYWDDLDFRNHQRKDVGSKGQEHGNMSVAAS